MADKEKMKTLIWDCQKDIPAYLPPESGISEHELLQMLIARFIAPFEAVPLDGAG